MFEPTYPYNKLSEENQKILTDFLPKKKFEYRFRGKPDKFNIDHLRFPFHYASYKGRIDILKILLSILTKKSDRVKFLNEQAENCIRPIHFATQYKHTECVRFLIANGARSDPRITETVQLGIEFKYTQHPVIMALKNGDLETFKVFMNNGIFIDQRYATNSDYRKPWNKRFPILFWVVLYCPNEKVMDFLNYLLEEKNATKYIHDTVEGNTLLHLLSAEKLKYYKPTVDYLLNSGIDINHQNNRGKTPLFSGSLFISRQKIAPCLKYLISKGADINIKDNDGNSILYAKIDEIERTMGPFHFWHETSNILFEIKFLLDNNPDLIQKNNKGEDMLDIIKKLEVKLSQTMTYIKQIPIGSTVLFKEKDFPVVIEIMDIIKEHYYSQKLTKMGNFVSDESTFSF